MQTRDIPARCADALRRIDEAHEKLDDQGKTLQRLADGVDSLDRAIRGNGRVGLTTRISVIEETVRRRQEGDDRFWRRLAVCVSAGGLLLAVLALAGGCASPTRRIARSAALVDAKAKAIETGAVAAEAELESAHPARPIVRRIGDDARAIQAVTAEITGELAGVQDKPDWWTRNLSSLAWIVGTIAAAYLAGGLIRPALARLGVWIAPTTRRTAELDAKGDARAATALRRANEPGYERAFQAAKRSDRPAPAS